MTFIDQITNAAGSIAANTAADVVTGQRIAALESMLLSMFRESPFKFGVQAASVGANLTLSTALVAGQALDGVTLAEGSRVLVKDQTDAKENGIYEVKATGAPARAIDFDDGAEVCGAYIPVLSGTTLKNKLYQCTNTECVVGSSNIVIIERAFSA